MTEAPKEQHAEQPTGRRPFGVRARIAISSLIFATLTLSALWASYSLLRPSRVDTCASEVLTNGRDMSVDLGAKTVSLAGESEGVPIQELSNESTIIIDGLSRICREMRDGIIDKIEYNRRFDNITAQIRRSIGGESRSLPIYEGDVDTRGYAGNAGLVNFLKENDGKVVRFRGAIDTSWYPSMENNDKACADEVDERWGRMIEAGENPGHPPVFNRELLLPLKSIDEKWNEEDESRHYCEEYMIYFRGKDEPVFTSGGTGISQYKVDNFFKVDSSMVGSTTTFYLTEVSSSAADFAD